ncbi:hypothetical protein EVAR_22798_1 [Eumeta japonica]|uniref:Uncharacterized protein n=1 Tax=Eumeta variegata TaxID=151549 RepID=A0A4C1VDY6_EUMVA|nr:hypothetical protein EVAR_22798_1 [Eumeta japonica]
MKIYRRLLRAPRPRRDAALYGLRMYKKCRPSERVPARRAGVAARRQTGVSAQSFVFPSTSLSALAVGKSRAAASSITRRDSFNLAFGRARPLRVDTHLYVRCL